MSDGHKRKDKHKRRHKRKGEDGRGVPCDPYAGCEDATALMRGGCATRDGWYVVTRDRILFAPNYRAVTSVLLAEYGSDAMDELNLDSDDLLKVILRPEEGCDPWDCLLDLCQPPLFSRLEYVCVCVRTTIDLDEDCDWLDAYTEERVPVAFHIRAGEDVRDAVRRTLADIREAEDGGDEGGDEDD